MIHFPELIAPASLKLRCKRRAKQAPTLFSGVNCSGLIEALKSADTLAQSKAFSGVNCSGLIEADSTDLKLTLSHTFSGVNCSGLIEAGYGSKVLQGAAKDFPELIAPASLKRDLALMDKSDKDDIFRS